MSVAALYVDWVSEAAAERFGIARHRLVRDRHATVVRARRVCLAALRELAPFLSSTEIAEAFGTTHTTVLSAAKEAAAGGLDPDFEAVKKLAIQKMPKDRRPA